MVPIDAGLGTPEFGGECRQERLGSEDVVEKRQKMVRMASLTILWRSVDPSNNIGGRQAGGRGGGMRD